MNREREEQGFPPPELVRTALELRRQAAANGEPGGEKPGSEVERRKWIGEALAWHETAATMAQEAVMKEEVLDAKMKAEGEKTDKSHYRPLHITDPLLLGQLPDRRRKDGKTGVTPDAVKKLLDKLPQAFCEDIKINCKEFVSIAQLEFLYSCEGNGVFERLKALESDRRKFFEWWKSLRLKSEDFLAEELRELGEALDAEGKGDRVALEEVFPIAKKLDLLRAGWEFPDSPQRNPVNFKPERLAGLVANRRFPLHGGVWEFHKPTGKNGAALLLMRRVEAND